MRLRQMMYHHIPVQYVYTYPTTRMYKPLPSIDRSTLFKRDDLNIYIHIPFCKQKCTFCGYITHIEKDDLQRDLYVDALINEIICFAPRNKKINSINFGGGTPSLLSEKQLTKIIATLKKIYPQLEISCTELSIEATPESISNKYLTTLKELGFTRVSLGIQTLNNHEIKTVGRHNTSQQSLKAIELVKKSGLLLCVDLMYGLPNQGIHSSLASLSQIANDFEPEAIELYRMVKIPGTVVDRKKIQNDWKPISGYRFYTRAQQILFSLEYIQDSHMRFTKPGISGYLQQSNVFKGESLIGFGVGARSYDQKVHFRNISQGRSPIHIYRESINQGIDPVESGIYLSSEEQARKELIYNLEYFDTKSIEEKYGLNFLEQIQNLNYFEELGAHTFKLKEQYFYDRDILAYYFFSQKIRKVEKIYYKKNLNYWL